jgi:hypothetical protein
MNTQGFEERLMQELKSYVHDQATQHAATDSRTQDEADTASVDGRRVVRPRPRAIAVGTGVAAVIAAAAYLAGSIGTTAGTGAAGGSPAVHRQLIHSANAAYDVQQEPDGTVKLTILDENGKADVNTLRNDLAKAGVNARVLSDVRDCTSPQPHPTPTYYALPPALLPPQRLTFELEKGKPANGQPGSAKGKIVYYFAPDSLLPGQVLTIMYAQSLRTFSVAISDAGNLPTCFPTPAYH